MLGSPSFSWKAETVHATALHGSFYYGSTAVHHFLGTIGSLGSEKAKILCENDDFPWDYPLVMSK